MNKNFFKTASALIMGLALLTSAPSCKKDDPVQPKKEQQEQTHEEEEEEFNNVRLRVIGGHLHGKYLFHQDTPMKGMKYFTKIQEIKLTEQNGEWKPAEDSPSKELIVRTGEGAIYGMWLDFYKGDSKVSSKFVENGAQDMHQIFFIPRNVKPNEFGSQEADDNQPDKIFEYLYCDTDPWNQSRHDYDTAIKKGQEAKEVKFIGETNPLGLKGHFHFLKNHKKFDLEIRLMHAEGGLKYDSNKKPSPFYRPSTAQLQSAHWDMIAKVPVHIYMSHSDVVQDILINGQDAWDYTTREDGSTRTLEEIFEALDKTKIEEYPEKDQKVFRSMMNAFGISFIEAQRELYLQVYGESTHSDDGFWF